VNTGKEAAVTLEHVLTYLADLETHNDRDWYTDHKTERLTAEAEFEALVADLQEAVASFVTGVLEHPPKTLTFKLHRDLRFSRDKSPYNPCFRAHFGPAGKAFIPMGPYLAIRPGDRSFIGAGLFATLPDTTRTVRDAIAADPDNWMAITKALPWPILGETLKTPPRGYPADHPCIDHLKYKSWYLQLPISDQTLQSPDFVTETATDFETMQPLNDFLNHALRDLKMPTR
jgi:uncharacterized protein (TIGR02453 family)